jgi:hypothetical protein
MSYGNNADNLLVYRSRRSLDIHLLVFARVFFRLAAYDSLSDVALLLELLSLERFFGPEAHSKIPTLSGQDGQK